MELTTGTTEDSRACLYVSLNPGERVIVRHHNRFTELQRTFHTVLEDHGDGVRESFVEVEAPKGSY